MNTEAGIDRRIVLFGREARRVVLAADSLAAQRVREERAFAITELATHFPGKSGLIRGLTEFARDTMPSHPIIAGRDLVLALCMGEFSEEMRRAAQILQLPKLPSAAVSQAPLDGIIRLSPEVNEIVTEALNQEPSVDKAIGLGTLMKAINRYALAHPYSSVSETIDNLPRLRS